MPAAKYDLLLEQGSLFTLDLIYKDGTGTPIDLTGYAARMQIRQKHSSPDPAALTFSTTDGSIVLGGVDGTIHVEASAEATSGVEIKAGVYDLELIPPSGEDDTFRLVEGTVTISKEVTRT